MQIGPLRSQKKRHPCLMWSLSSKKRSSPNGIPEKAEGDLEQDDHQPAVACVCFWSSSSLPGACRLPTACVLRWGTFDSMVLANQSSMSTCFPMKPATRDVVIGRRVHSNHNYTHTHILCDTTCSQSQSFDAVRQSLKNLGFGN